MAEDVDYKDNEQLEGQLDFDDVGWGLEQTEPPEKLFAVSNVLARARKQMSVAELKTFIYALTEVKWTEEAPNVIYLNKKTLAEILGIHSDTDHLSVDVYSNIKDLPKNSYVEFKDKDLDLYDSGVLVTRVTMLKNRVKIKFEDEYLKLFSSLKKDYITMWSGDIFKLRTERSIIFYENMRLNSDTRKVCSKVYKVKELKELFSIPKDGKGSYMRQNGHFNRPAFEEFVINPLVEDLLKCRMIQLVAQEDGGFYSKVKAGNRVMGYRFCWIVTDNPSIGTATEMHEVQREIEKNPQTLKIVKDKLKGDKKPAKAKKNQFNSFELQGNIDVDALEKAMLAKN
jgi:hypothetical protein